MDLTQLGSQPDADCDSDGFDLRPQAEMGKAWSQSPLWAAAAVSSLARANGIVCELRSDWNILSVTALSQTF
jgi:hypothetical protein